MMGRTFTTKLVGVLGAAFMGAGWLIASGTPANAQALEPITSYADYPAPLPPGCPDGRGAVLGATFSNGRGGVESDLSQLDLANGDTLTMTWDDFAPGCVDADGTPLIALSMPVYDAGAPAFDASIDQVLMPDWSACGAGATPCLRNTSGRYELSVTIPGMDVLCDVQTGTAIGLPLKVVGPSGSYYSAVLRGDDRPTMLVASKNFGVDNCVPASTTTTTDSGVLPSSVVSTTVTSAPPLVTAPAQTTLPPAVLPSSFTSLPVTGRSTGTQAGTGAALAAAGAVLIAGAVAVQRRASRPNR